MQTTKRRSRDSSGHHGVSVGDADGDGLDDIYVAQPYGFPNRLYRNRGDGTFEDATESYFPRFKQALEEEQNARITSLVNRDGFWMA